MNIVTTFFTVGLFVSVTAFDAFASLGQDVQKNAVKQVQLGGFVGSRVHTCVEKRVKSQDVEELIAPFRQMTEGDRWQSEFFGKWLLGAIASYEYTQDTELYSKIKDAVLRFLETQQPDGYIGNYKPENHLTGWDIWGRKYTALSLLSYYRLTQDRKALDAVVRLMDHLIGELKAKEADIAKTGFYRGMASCSILEPVVYLYQETRESRFLEFAKYIVRCMEKEGNNQLITKALQDVPVFRRFPFPKHWWSYENGQKAYEMMSCYEGLVEFGKVVGDPLYKVAAEKAVANIVSEEINIAGSGAAFECWYGGKEKQTLPAYHTMETCVTFTWMQLCARLFTATGNSMYIDEFEKTMYNALMAAMKRDGSQISKYSPLEGRRQEGEHQCGMEINCCNANGPRAFALIPKVAYQAKGENVYVNLYVPSETCFSVGKNEIELVMQTSYPLDGKVEMTLNPRKKQSFTLSLRIPSWLDNDYTVSVNGESQECLHKGGYLQITREWNAGDKVVADFKLKTKVVECNHHQAVVHGPLVFARDSRFSDGDVDECAVIRCNDKGVVPAILKETASSSFAWITMEVPVVTGTDLENPVNKEGRKVRFCDFASSGNDWDPNGRYRVWIPKTLHVMSEQYHKY